MTTDDAPPMMTLAEQERAFSGEIPWSRGGVEEAWAFMLTLTAKKRDDWPSLRMHPIHMEDTGDTYTFNQFHTGNQLTRFLMDRYGPTEWPAHWHRCHQINAFLEGKWRKRLLHEGLIRNATEHGQEIKEELLEALATLPYSERTKRTRRFNLPEVLHRVDAIRKGAP